jgi:hypothetical protein
VNIFTCVTSHHALHEELPASVFGLRTTEGYHAESFPLGTTGSGPFMESTDKHSICPPYQLRQYDSISKNTSLFDREEKSLSRAGKAEAGEHALGQHKWHDICLAITISFVSYGITDCW